MIEINRMPTPQMGDQDVFIIVLTEPPRYVRFKVQTTQSSVRADVSWMGCVNEDGAQKSELQH